MWTQSRQYNTNGTSFNERAYPAAGMYQKLLPEEIRPMPCVKDKSTIDTRSSGHGNGSKEQIGVSETGIITPLVEAEMSLRLQVHMEMSLRLQVQTEMLLRLQKQQKVILRLQKQQKRILPLQDPRLQESLRRSISVMTQ